MTGSVRSRSLSAGLALLLAACLMVLALPAVAFAKTYYVSVIGDDAGGDGSVNFPYASIQKAVDQTVSGDVVDVGPGSFTGRVVVEDGVTLDGAGPSLTILRGAGSDSAVVFSSAGGATISGLTITGGTNAAFGGGGIYIQQCSPTIIDDTITGNSATGTGLTGYGGGIECDYSSSPAIIDDTITGNSASLAGGGISCNNSSAPTIIDDTITGNTAGEGGGGIYCDDSSPAITGDTIIGNDAAGTISGSGGGGIYCDEGAAPTITNDVIASNAAVNDGGGIYCSPLSAPKVVNDTITGNNVNSADGGGGIDNSSGSPMVTNCICWDNSGYDIAGCSASYSDGFGASGVCVGEIDANPDFVAASQGNFRLSAGSPCIDAASPTVAPATDKDGIPRPWGPGYDIGAYEYYVSVLHTSTSLFAPSSVRHRSTLALSGTVLPSYTPFGKVTIAMTLKVGKKWKKYATAKVSVVEGRFSYSFRPKYKGSWRFVASYSGGVLGPTTYLPSKSGVKGVTVK